MRFNIKQTAALLGAAAGGAVLHAIAHSLSAEDGDDDSNFLSVPMQSDDMVSITIDGHEVINVWIDHNERLSAEFVRSNVEITESFASAPTGVRERAEFSTLALRMEHYNRLDNSSYEGLFDEDDIFVPLDGFEDDPLYDLDEDAERWFAENRDLV